MRARLPYQTLERIAKSHDCRSACIVGSLEPGHLTSLVCALARTRLVFVHPWLQAIEDADGPTRKAWARASMVRMTQLSASYDRVEMVDADVLTGHGTVAGPFDLVALLDVDPETLVEVGPSWTPLVRDGGVLVGSDHRQEGVRTLLSEDLPNWRRHDDGLWSAVITRPVVAEPASEPKRRGRPPGSANRPKAA